jgi:hypothetical protein
MSLSWSNPSANPIRRGDIRDVRRPHGVQTSPEDVNLGCSRANGPVKPDTEISFSAPWRTTEQEGRRFGGNAALNSKDLRLFLEQRV